MSLMMEYCGSCDVDEQIDEFCFEDWVQEVLIGVCEEKGQVCDQVDGQSDLGLRQQLMNYC